MQKIYLVSYMKEEFKYVGSKDKNYFEGWYFKHTSKDYSFACIPGICKDYAFIQIIDNNKSMYFKYDLKDFKYVDDTIWIGENKFNLNGIELNIYKDKYSISCNIEYTNHIYYKSNIMGPFSKFNMECNHCIICLKTDINGYIKIGDKTYIFESDLGYIEKDRGTSFPKKYMWLQANDKKSSIFLANAVIPLMGIKFLGHICVLYANGKEYKFATYNFSKITKQIKNKNGMYVKLVKGKYTLEINASISNEYKLKSPKNGCMENQISEAMGEEINLILRKKDKIIYSKKYENGAVEYNL